MAKKVGEMAKKAFHTVESVLYYIIVRTNRTIHTSWIRQSVPLAEVGFYKVTVERK